MEMSVRKVCGNNNRNKVVISVRQCANFGRIITDDNTSRYLRENVWDACYPGYFDGPDITEDENT